MTFTLWLLAAAVVGYLLGSLSPAVIVARAFGVDLYGVGSGNPGATNVGRALGLRWAILVGVMDVLKGLVPALAFGALAGEVAGEVAGFFAVLGHVTSPFLLGRGGKGVATALGAILGVQPWFVLPVLLGFGVGVLIWHRIGLGAVLGALALALAGAVGWATGFMDTGTSDGIFALALAALVLVRHERNVAAVWRQLDD